MDPRKERCFWINFKKEIKFYLVTFHLFMQK
jgi:hypothetical protein